MEISGVMPSRDWIKGQLQAWADFQRRKGTIDLNDNQLDSLTGHLYGNWLQMVTYQNVTPVPKK